MQGELSGNSVGAPSALLRPLDPMKRRPLHVTRVRTSLLARCQGILRYPGPGSRRIETNGVDRCLLACPYDVNGLRWELKNEIELAEIAADDDTHYDHDEVLLSYAAASRRSQVCPSG